MQEKQLSLAALIAALAALGVSIFLWMSRDIGPSSVTDDQPVTMSGGSMHMRSVLDWEFRKPDSSAVNFPHFLYASVLPVEKVEWACNYSAEPTLATRKPNTQVDIQVTYGEINGGPEFQTLYYLTDPAGKNLRVWMTKANNTSVSKSVLRSLINIGTHPRSKWEARTLVGKGFDTDFACSPNNGDFFLRIRPCSGTGCNP